MAKIETRLDCRACGQPMTRLLRTSSVTQENPETGVRTVATTFAARCEPCGREVCVTQTLDVHEVRPAERGGRT